MGGRLPLSCMTIVAMGLAPDLVLAQARQIRAALEVSVIVVRVCTVGVEVAPTPGCEAVVRDTRWPGEHALAPKAKQPEARSELSQAGEAPSRLVVRTVDF